MEIKLHQSSINAIKREACKAIVNCSSPANGLSDYELRQILEARQWLREHEICGSDHDADSVYFKSEQYRIPEGN